MDLVPGTSKTIRVGFSENADDVAHQLAEILGVDTVIGADAAAHVSLLRETVREELALALEHLGMDPQNMKSRVEQALCDVALDGTRKPSGLSGGQTRRLALAQVAIAEPPVLIVVEPWAGLDPDSRERIASYLGTLKETAVILVEHDTSADGILDLARVAPTSESVTISQVRATRGAKPRRWWHLKAPESSTFEVGPVDLKLRPGGVLWLRGGNGSGKTTLLRAAAGLDSNEPAHPSIAMALQSPMDQVLESTIGAWVQEPALIPDLPLEEHPLDVSASQLRVAQVAYAVALRRSILILDEPDTLLDARGRVMVHRLIHNALSASTAIVLTCHDPAFVAEVATYATVDEMNLAN